RHSGYNEVGGAGEDMTRGRPSRVAEGESGGGRKGGGEGVRVYSTVQYTPYTYKTPRVQTGGGGGWGPASRHTASWSANSEASTPS
ncbi:MAG: hypothetical protein ACK53Y_09750, partial [bacterium]